LQYEHQLAEQTTKNLEAMKSFQMKYDKVLLENQEKTNAMNKFLVALNRLKSDLHFLYISKNLRILGLAEKSSEQNVKNSPNPKEDQKHDEFDKEDQISTH